MAVNAATAPPPDTPSTYGSASGLRSSICISAPASASSAPQAKAAPALGRRSPVTMPVARPSPLPVSACHTCPGDSRTLPSISEATSTATHASASSDHSRQAKPRAGSAGVIVAVRAVATTA